MPPFNDGDKAEILGLLTGAFGVPEGKTLADFLAESTDTRINAILNGYDKRQTKNRETLEGKLAEITEALTKLGEGRGDGGDGGDGSGDDGDGLDDTKLPKAVREALAAMKKQNEALAKQLDAEKKAREKEREDRQRIEAEQAEGRMFDAFRSTALSKEIGVDPDSLDFLVAFVKQNGLLKKNEAGEGYVFKHGKDAITGEPTWLDVAEGLTKFVSNGPGARFKAPVPGNGGGSVPRDGGSGGPSGAISLEQLEKLRPSEVEAAAQAGKIRLEG